MFNLHKSKKLDLVDMFIDISSRYICNRTTVEQCENFKQINVIGSDVHTGVYDKRDYFGFPITNSPWLSGDSHRTVFALDFSRCRTSVFDFHSKNFQKMTQGYIYHKLRKIFGKFVRSNHELLSNFGEISFQEYVYKGIFHLAVYGDLVYKQEGQKCSEFRLIRLENI